MAAAARALGRPGAADATVELLASLSDGQPLPDQEQVDRRARAAT
jgi:hypothetical protein